MKFVLLPELRGRWSWQLRHADQILAASAMSFGSRQMALVSIRDFSSKAPRSPVYDTAGQQLGPTPDPGR